MHLIFKLEYIFNSSSHLMVGKTVNKHISQSVTVPLNALISHKRVSVREPQLYTDILLHHAQTVCRSNSKGRTDRTVSQVLIEPGLSRLDFTAATAHNGRLNTLGALWIQTPIWEYVLSEDTCSIKMTGVTTARD